MLKATQEDLRSWNPCWGARRLEAYLADRPQEFTALDVLDWPDLTANDRMWVLLRQEMIPVGILKEFAIDCAEHVVQKDPRSVRALQVARAYLRGGATREDLEEARRAAYAAYAAYAASDAASDAYADAYAAYAASASDAAYAAYVASDASAAYAAYAEREWQFSRLRELLSRAS